MPIGTLAILTTRERRALNSITRTFQFSALGAALALCASCTQLPPAARLAAPSAPELCIGTKLASCVPLGTWAVIDQTIRTRPGQGAGSWSTTPFLLWVHDNTSFISATEKATIQFHGVQYQTEAHTYPPNLTVPPGPTGYEFGTAPDTLIHTAGNNELELGARLGSYTNTYKSSDLPTYFVRVTTTLNAGSFRYIGIQAGTVGQCKNYQITSLPSQPSPSLAIENELTTGPCILKVRLCSTTDSPIFRTLDSCAEYPGL